MKLILAVAYSIWVMIKLLAYLIWMYIVNVDWRKIEDETDEERRES